MSVTTQRPAYPSAWLGATFDRIVCCVDGTDSDRVAVTQAARLVAARNSLELFEETPVRSSGWLEPSDAEWKDAQHDRRAGVRSMLFFVDPGPKLVSAARELDATLAVVGAPVGGRLGGFVLDSAGTYVLHNSPCSVLIARQPAEDDTWPRTIAVGHDGSRGAANAAVVARELAFRFGAALRFVVATGGDPVDVDSLPSDEELDWSPWQPVNALEAASAECDLLVVGSRGLRSPRALGSVSEAIGDLAHCSVLVVREPPHSSQLERGVEDAVPDPEC
jgi:nucleotide-binding universal stress UspA family protein